MSVGKDRDNTNQYEFPSGRRVLAVDDDSTSLKVLAKMLQSCGYEVTKCSRAMDALSILRQEKSKFDVVISDVHTWKQVVYKQKSALKVLEQSKNVEINAEMHQKQSNVEGHLALTDKEDYGSSNCGMDEKDEEGKEKDDSVSRKRPRMVWTAELHQQFVAAVNQIGFKEAVPKKILEVMNVSGLTRENVASHLQKYRSYVRKADESSGLESNFNNAPTTHYSGCPATSTTTQLQSLSLQQIEQQRMFSSYMPLNFYNNPSSRFEQYSTVESDHHQINQVVELQNDDQSTNIFNSPANSSCAYGTLQHSSMAQRPFKMQRLDKNGCLEDFNPCDVSNRNATYISNSSYEPTLFEEHFDHDEEQFIGAAEGKFSFDGYAVNYHSM